MSLREQLVEQASPFDNPVLLLSVNPVVYQGGVLDAIRYLSERYGKGLYITLNKPYATLQESFRKKGLSPEKLVYLDSITSTHEHDTESCRFLGRMRELTDLGIALTKFVSQRKDEKFVLLDSVSTLLIYNDAK